jgi:branched-chain amino acid transport system substrate-binding protein
VYAKYILENKPNGKIAILYQNDDFGKDMLKGVKDGLGDKASMIVAVESYESTEPTIDGRIVSLKSSGADIFISLSSPKFEAQAIKKTFELGWQPLHMLSSTSSSIGSVIKPAGYDASQGVISVAFLKDVTDPEWKEDAGVKEFDAFLKDWYPGGDRADGNVAYGMMSAETLVHVLKMCGDDLTRENVMKQAANIKDLELSLLLPGIKLNTSADDFFPIEQEQLIRFKGESWERFGPIIDGRVGD